MARKFVEAHGGTMSVSSRPGQGATFQVTLPGAAAALIHAAARAGRRGRIDPVRELMHVIERAVLVHPKSTVDAEDLGLRMDAASPGPAAAVPVVVKPGADVQVDFASGGIMLEEVERRLIREALEAAGWNRTRAAHLLGISTDTLRYRIMKYQFRPPATNDGGRREP